jgi:pimeloyl-ACP methyl ester carboxylesterase
VGLAYERQGSGPPLVLLHGVGHRRQAWGAVLGRLTPHRDVIVVDLPGHGESPPLDLAGRPVLDAMLDEVAGLFGELGLERPHVAGNSLGGRLALELGVAGRAATVTALSPAGFWRNRIEIGYDRAVFGVMEFIGARTQQLAPVISRSAAGRAVVYGAIVSRPGLLTPEQAMGDMAAFVAARDAMHAVLDGMTNFAGSVPAGVPVLIGWGERDRLLFPGQALLARAQLPEARVVRLAGCGHVPMTDAPALVASLLLRGSSGG